MTAAGDATVARRTLHQVLRRTLLAVMMLAVLVAGGLLTLFGTAMLRGNAQANLQLVARSVSYTLEAAVVFHDDQAAADALALIANTEDVAEAWVYDHQGRLLVHWTRDAGRPWQWLRGRLARLLLPPVVDVPVLHGDAEVGQVVMRAAGDGLTGFVLYGMAVILACLGLGALAAAWALQGVLPSILAPLQQLASVVRAGRMERSLDRRVPGARIAEFHELGEDVNALLAELEARQQGLQRENAHLAQRALTDSLTGLWNRAAFEQGLERALTTAAIDASRLAVLFLDGDGFKKINDSLGHEVGDAVLVVMAERIRGQLREQDLVARMGGDEFAVLLHGLRDAQDARLVSDAIQRSMIEPIELPDGRRVMGSLSIGLAVFPDDAADAAGLVRAADQAMYQGKRQRAARSGRGLPEPAPEPEPR